MTGRLAQVEARIETIGKLSTVINAMRSIAAARAQEARTHLDSIRAYAETIGAGIGQALACLPQDGGPPVHHGGDGREALIVLCAEQGFAGAFSRKTLDAAGARQHRAKNENQELLIVGTRGMSAAEEEGLTIQWCSPMISHPSQTGALADRITEAIYERLAAGDISQVSIVHRVPGLSATQQILKKRLVPFDFSRFTVAHTVIEPRLTLPPDRLFAQLAQEYVFAELSEAVMLSFAAENEARMRAMLAAHDNVAETLQDLIGTSRRLRQEEITNEIIELASSGTQSRPV
ncbi:FoF1 ATP synthase subunit gamma [Breoghania sp.]|uniref:F0F1 ATP synthase subunit gamma n=1 Tax=Breoghania sp. TaxID=2065378 RepID=UPI0029CAA712|nr:FoF1 ATP synthase subunit gamma [Breoghania sp.]